MCISTWSRKDLVGVSLPCGKCYQCKENRAKIWAFRLSKEAERSTSAFFITLTYANEHITVSKNKKLPTLVKSDVMDWMKKLRKRQDLNRLKYYLCGEYGTKSFRPHYHVILFNAVIPDKYVDRLKLSTQGMYDHQETDISKSWRNAKGEILGNVHIGTLTKASIAYTLKYISKDGRIPYFEGDDRLPEFSLMSKKLGENYLTDEIIDYHRDYPVERMFIKTDEGFQIPLPRYYKNKLWPDEKERERINERYRDKLDYDKWNKNDEEMTQERAIIAERIRKFKRKSQKNEKDKF